MTEKQLAVFRLMKMFFILLEALSRLAWLRGVAPAWLTRNLARFTTLLFGASVFIEADWKKMHAFIFLMGLGSWNWPKDGDGPKRKRRKQETKEEKRAPNWSGVPEAA